MDFAVLNDFILKNYYFSFSRFEKAYLLAVDIGSRDLFMVSLLYNTTKICIIYSYNGSNNDRFFSM